MSNIMTEAIEFAKQEYAKHDPMHRWDHIEQVMGIAEYLLPFYKDSADEEILRLAVLFHDIWYDNYDEHVDKSVEVTSEFLKGKGYPEDRIVLVTKAMLDHSGPHRRKNGESKTIEGKIMYDSDKFHLALTPSGFDKYFGQLYLQETKDLVLTKREEQLC